MRFAARWANTAPGLYSPWRFVCAE